MNNNAVATNNNIIGGYDMNNNALNNLMGFSPKIREFLHNTDFLDWTNNIFIEEYAGKFTHNTIKKQLAAAGIDQIKDYNIFMLYYNNSINPWHKGKLYIAKITDYDILCTNKQIDNKYYSYHDNIDIPWKKAIFDEMRKNENTKYFIIAQKKSYAKHRAGDYSENERYIMHYSTYIYNYGDKTNYISDVCIKPYHRANDHYKNINSSCYGRRPYRDILEKDFYKVFVDKSGYRIDVIHENYKQRVRALKAAKSAAAAAQYDNTEILKNIDYRIKAINEKIITLLSDSSIQNIPYTKIYNAANHINWIKAEYKNLKENKYTSMEKINFEIDHLNRYIEKAENALNEQ